MNFDQYEDPRPEQVELARAVTVLLSAIIDKDGKPRDLADREGRKALQQAIDNFPRKIPTELNEVDRRLLNASIEEMKKTQKAVKDWFWWVIGTMVLASSVISLCAVMLLR